MDNCSCPGGKNSIINVITQVLAYRASVGITDNPNQRYFDWTRKINAVELANPDSDGALIAPGGSYTIFDGTETNPLDGSSILSLALLAQAGSSNYRLSVTAGTSGFRTPRTISGLGTLAALVVQDLTYTSVIQGYPGQSTTIAYAVVPAWSSITAYTEGQIVSFSGQNYVALQTFGNTNQEPDTSPTYWSITTDGTAGHELVSVLGQAISVLIQSGASTATQILTAVQASLAASALVTVAVTGVGTNPQTGPVTPTALAGAQYTTVSLNNNAFATFDFGSAVLTGVLVGDVLRIAGVAVYDGAGPFAFNPVNAGFWTVIGVAGSVLTVTRPTGQQFVGVTEFAPSQPSDVQIFSQAGIQVGDKITISGTFNQVANGTYRISAVTPSTLDLFSSAPLPIQSGLTYVPSTINFYTAAKRFVYIEVDQPAVVQFNADVSNNVQVNPIVAGDQSMVGYLHKWGDAYKCVVQNTSVNPMHLRYFTGE